MRIFLLEATYAKPEFPAEINFSIKEALAVVSRSKFFHLFKDNIETLPLIANLVNALAKRYYDNSQGSAYWYKKKKALLAFLVKNYNSVWADEKNNVIHAQTPFGQINFHTKRGLIKKGLKYGISPESRTWDGKHLQRQALRLIDEYISELAGSHTRK